MNAKKMFGLAVTAAGVTVPFLGGHASADDGSFRDKSVNDAKQAQDAAEKAPTYVIQKGDTLDAISEVTGVSVADLASYNNLATQNFIVTGDELKLTGNGETSSAAQPSTTATTDSAATATAPEAAPATTNTVVDSNDSTFAALNSIRVAAGLAPLQWDAGLAAKATSRAAIVASSGIPADHWTMGGEVIAIGFGAGSSVVTAWYNETNMVGGPAHHNWEMNGSYTHVGFGYVNGVIVGEAY
jgi:uncharacterized protein YkwD